MTANIRNIPLKKYLKFLESVGCKCRRTRGGHLHYSRKDLNRSITVQSHIDPVPIFIVKQHLRILEIDKKEFIDQIDDL